MTQFPPSTAHGIPFWGLSPAKVVVVYAAERDPRKIEKQVQTCSKFCRDVRGRDPVVFTDLLRSYDPPRNGFAGLLVTVKAGNVAVVLVTEVSRISSNPSHVMEFADRLAKCGVELRCVASNGTSEKMNPFSLLVELEIERRKTQRRKRPKHSKSKSDR
jgi:DNA invertase Pin-like site-specific DNA recombinase